jgi:hypothetical protein
MQPVEREPEDLIASRVRYFRALRLLGQTELHTAETLQAIQCDHINYQDSICNHAVDDNRPLDREKTITALLFDLTARTLQACWGNPCENKFYTYELNC